MDSFDSYLIRKINQATARHGDNLAKIEKRINWKTFTPIIHPNYNKQGHSGGRPNMEPVLMVKLLVLQVWYSLSDPELKRQASAHRFYTFSRLHEEGACLLDGVEIQGTFG